MTLLLIELLLVGRLLRGGLLLTSTNNFITTKNAGSRSLSSTHYQALGRKVVHPIHLFLVAKFSDEVHRMTCRRRNLHDVPPSFKRIFAAASSDLYPSWTRALTILRASGVLRRHANAMARPSQEYYNDYYPYLYLVIVT
uniref:Secreted protein n=1 Tax=Panagrellus redivivus TaxID=6233 RepID=A0A7E4V260_PANRE